MSDFDDYDDDVSHELIAGIGDRDLPKVWRLRWIDPSYHDLGGAVGEFERTREFPYLGAAIAWARRQLFHGRVFGDWIEMETVKRMRVGGRMREDSDKVVDITLAGFCGWDLWQRALGYRPSATLYPPDSKRRLRA